MLFQVCSIATGQIFAENLTGEGSARRWAASRGLTVSHVESDETLVAVKESRENWIQELLLMQEESPELARWIQEEIDTYSLEACRCLFVTDDYCPGAGAYIVNGRYTWTYAFVD